MPSTPPTASAAVTVSASPQAVYDLVSDVTRTGEYSAECVSCEWLDGGTAAVGARFRGRNRRGRRGWSTVSRVTDAEPGKRFAFEVITMGTPVARWQFDLVATGDGCTVTESTWDRRPAWLRYASIPVTGVRDRTAENTRNISRTLDRLKSVVES
ncbi:SRPBCC family protein [Fodinicola acaciae]|uniref:SRPBCC family protein n=1 Tax=Fodinicola acaciae TaxID=2681555 RepID=UPI0013D4A423|nr:SRPBCC family protein [Fodinicola acaciae]